MTSATTDLALDEIHGRRPHRVPTGGQVGPRPGVGEHVVHVVDVGGGQRGEQEAIRSDLLRGHQELVDHASIIPPPTDIRVNGARRSAPTVPSHPRTTCMLLHQETVFTVQ
ncbi:hypothetical protein P9139_05845 [Curtobacterium flaccumfaciens]|nr:hypothetical protein P9139_05845 [Curtobacterium flaccumfaciens]